MRTGAYADPEGVKNLPTTRAVFHTGVGLVNVRRRTGTRGTAMCAERRIGVDTESRFLL